MTPDLKVRDEQLQELHAEEDEREQAEAAEDFCVRARPLRGGQRAALVYGGRDVPVDCVLEELRLDDAERVDAERQQKRGHNHAPVRLQVPEQTPDAPAVELAADGLFFVELLYRCRHRLRDYQSPFRYAAASWSRRGKWSSWPSAPSTKSA
jgi:hypothetical protein